jgi:hypothetical protein
MEKDATTTGITKIKPRGWDAIEIKLKERGLSCGEIEEARKSFYEGIEVLSKMFLVSYEAEKKGDKA